jgi:hypothetical protein
MLFHAIPMRILSSSRDTAHEEISRFRTGSENWQLTVSFSAGAFCSGVCEGEVRCC